MNWLRSRFPKALCQQYNLVGTGAARKLNSAPKVGTRLKSAAGVIHVTGMMTVLLRRLQMKDARRHGKLE